MKNIYVNPFPQTKHKYSLKNKDGSVYFPEKNNHWTRWLVSETAWKKKKKE